MKKHSVFLVGKCDTCKKKILNTDSFVTFATRKNVCLKCYRQDNLYEESSPSSGLLF